MKILKFVNLLVNKKLIVLDYFKDGILFSLEIMRTANVYVEPGYRKISKNPDEFPNQFDKFYTSNNYKFINLRRSNRSSNWKNCANNLFYVFRLRLMALI